MSELKYACTGCGTLRTKAEGGTTFTVCDECWNKRRADRDHNCDAMGCSSVRHDTPCLCYECSIIPKVQLSMAAALARKFDEEMMADVAQPEEQPICSGKVAGSKPAVGSPQILNMIQLRSGRLLTLTEDEVIELYPILRGFFNR